jgi:SpoVK/Ycf46/Vps4 family AAA+-type ATPase
VSSDILDIDIIKEPAEDDEVMRSFDDLVIEQKHKELVLAMVKNHSRETVNKISKRHRRESAAHSTDLVKGKGKGIIILLHGAPGVGKTSTAHCVAAFTNRPLYPITCGDIGDTAEVVEKNLDHHFRLAHQWGCVLLLDEADIFLAKREQGLSDVSRNGLVSVFLRVLEYYAGILFLTTNRVGSFDEAFQSRIHISLYYPPLTPYTALEIWGKNLDRLARRDTLEIDREGILEYGRKHFKTTKWNGRQVRNRPCSMSSANCFPDPECISDCHSTRGIRAHSKVCRPQDEEEAQTSSQPFQEGICSQQRV